MTTSDMRTQSTRTESELRLQLRGLRREIEPGHDLWPGIQARIGQLPAQAAAPSRGNPAMRLAPWALAASLVLAVGVAWRMQPPPASVQAADDGTGVAAVALDREADAMTAEYRAALQELQTATPRPSLARREQPALRELDQSARQIREAIALDPQSRFLLERLRRTYALRLELTQHAITQGASLG